MNPKDVRAEGRTAFAARRIVWLHERIRGGSFPNSAGLREKFGISETQAKRDVRTLRELGAPLVFDTKRRGFRYDGEFVLPDRLSRDDTEDSLRALAFAEMADGGNVQMRIPDTAVVEIGSRVSALELGGYVVSRAEGRDRYLCEFRNPDLFLGMILASGQKVRIVSPDWLREKLLSLCRDLQDANS